MLNKRFKIAKCKTSLKLATSRIKLMKNKKAIQINQMKRELAQLLESGQDRTARIRVEHVIREEKMIAAYDLIEIYCELIVARLPIIESQKTCPIDLKEAITSVIFAAPRCSDIPELVDARKNFTAKYGKEFASAALELRPDSGVNRMMVEKLSAVAPDIQTKMKVLSAVAKEHNVNWDPTLFEEKESRVSDDLLKGHVNFEKASVMNVDTPKIQTSNVQNVHSHEEKLNVPDNFSQQNRRYTMGTQNMTSTDTNASGMASEMTNRRHSFHTNSNNSSSGKEKSWNMEFKDATSAAQAAAESAERASMAAKAAAHLSSQGKISRQHSTQSPKATVTSEVPSQYHVKENSYNNSFKDRNPPHEHGTSPKATQGVRKQPSITSSGSQSSTMTDENDIYTSDLQKVGNRTVVDHGNISRGNIKTSSYGSGHRDDESETDSDDDDDENRRFEAGLEYDEGELARSFFPSPGREEESITHISSPKNKSGDKQDLQKVNSRKTRIELNDLSSSVYEDAEVKRVQSLKPSRKNDVEPQIAEKDSDYFLNQADDLETGKELKFGTLTGGLRNNGGIKYVSPYTKTGVNNSASSSKQGSFNSRASRLETREQSVSVSSSESESDDRSNSVKNIKTGSRFAPPDYVSFTDDGISDSEEEASPVPKPILSTGQSRRTKDHVKPKGKTVISGSTEKNPESPRNSQAHIARFKEETFRRKTGAKISEQQPSPREKLVGPGIMEARKTLDLSSESLVEANDVKKPSHVHPKLPDYDSLAARIQSLRANR